MDYRGVDTTDGVPKVDYISIPSNINLNAQSHFIDVAYTKDGSAMNGTDTFQIKIEHMSASNMTLSPDAVLLSTETSINIGVVDEQTMEPLNLVAVFAGNYEQPTQNGDELLVTQVYRSEQNENILEVE
jgi:hypothetical protein